MELPDATRSSFLPAPLWVVKAIARLSGSVRLWSGLDGDDGRPAGIDDVVHPVAPRAQGYSDGADTPALHRARSRRRQQIGLRREHNLVQLR